MTQDLNADSRLSHLDADTDTSITAIHHTLGSNPTQASPGSHRHDGTDSHRIKVTDLDGTLSATNGLPAGGTADQILSKIDGTDYNAQWVDNTAIQKGDGIFVYVYNNTGSTLTKGQVVYTTGANGNKVTVALALATGDQYSARTLGLISADILNNDYGYVQIEGYLSGVNTASLTDGAQLYLSGTVAGGYTSTKTSAPTHMVYVGVVAKAAAAAGGGAIMVKVQNGYELDELHDVQIVSKANGDLIKYDSSTNLWKNAAQSTLAIDQSQVTNLTTDLAGKASLASNNTFTNNTNTLVAGTGATTLNIRQGATQSTTNLLQITNNAGNSTLASISSTGAITAPGVTTTSGLYLLGSNSPIVTSTGMGTGGQLLTSNGAGSTPYWSTPVIASKTVISTVSLSGTSTINFTSIPSSYRDLEIRILTTTAVTTSGALTLTVNGLSTSIYLSVHQYVNGVSPSTITYSQQTGSTSANLTPQTFGATASSALILTIPSYTSGSFKTSDLTWMGGPSAGTYFHGFGNLFFKTTSAISSISIAVAGTGGINGTATLLGVA